MQLSVGTGVDGSSVLSSSKKNVRLDAGSQFVLVPRLKSPLVSDNVPAKPTNSSNSSLSGTKPTGSEVSIPDETETCAPPKCNLVLTPAEPEIRTDSEARTISTKEFGYHPRTNRDMEAFDHDAAIAYLGPQKLLFTFNPHLLVSRPGSEASPQMRIVRADSSICRATEYSELWTGGSSMRNSIYGLFETTQCWFTWDGS